MSILEYHARAGSEHTPFFRAPSALDGDPVMTVRMSGGDVTPDVTQLRAEATVTAVASDRKTLTVGAMAGALFGLQGDRGGWGHFRTERHGLHAVRIKQVTSTTTVILAEPLPFVFVAGSSDLLAWSTWYATLTTVAVTGTALTRPVPFTWLYARDNGSAMPSQIESQEGLLYVVRQPFNTGLDDDTLISLVPALAGAYPLRQTSWQPQIELAEQTLRRWIRRELQSEGLNEHAVNGAAFVAVHAFLAAWTVMQGGTAASGNRDAQRDDYLAAAKALFADIAASWPWIDTDGDGTPESGETDVTLGLTADDAVASLFHGDSDFESTDFPVFSRHMKH